MERNEPTHAKLPKLFVHAPGLFRNISKKSERDTLDITYEIGDTIFRLTGPEVLNATDLRVLQGLSAIATKQVYQPLGVRQLLRDGRAERLGLALTGDALTHRKQHTIAARVNLSVLASAVGYARPGGATRRMLRESIERLSCVTVSVQRTDFVGSHHIISKGSIDSRTGELVVALNPILTTAILGRKNYLRIDTGEMQKLKSDAARLMHMRLHWINQGESGNISIDTLCKYVYADTPTTTVAAKKRRREVRAALKELAGLEWSISEPGKASDTYRIRRARIRSRAPEEAITNASEQVPIIESE